MTALFSRRRLLSTALGLLAAAGVTAALLPASHAAAADDTKGLVGKPAPDFSLKTLDGKDASLGDLQGKAVLVVNVASKCGLTPQYEGLEKLHEQYADRGFSVVGFPCNQFKGQEPGSADEIMEFCSMTYGVTFPLYEKIDVNGENRHPIYEELTKAADAEGATGDIRWNFE